MEKLITEWPKFEKFSVIDIEADGNREARPIEISILDFENGKIIKNNYWLINPECQIQDYVQKHIHGITNKMVKNCPTFSDIKDEVINCLKNKTIVGHSIKNDFKILRSVIDYPELLPSKIIDTATLAKLTLNTKDKISLEKVCNVLGIQIPDEFRCNRPNFHGSAEDAYATAQLLFELPKNIPDDITVIKQISNNIVIRTDYVIKEIERKNKEIENEYNGRYTRP